MRILIPDAAAFDGAASGRFPEAISSVGSIREALRRIPGVTRVDEVTSESGASPIHQSGSPVATAGPGQPTNANTPAKTGRGRGRSRGGGGTWGGGTWNGGGNATSSSSEDGSEAGTVLFRLYAENTAGLVTGVSQVLAEADAEVRDLHLKRPSLEDVFIYLTGRNLR